MLYSCMGEQHLSAGKGGSLSVEISSAVSKACKLPACHLTCSCPSGMGEARMRRKDMRTDDHIGSSASSALCANGGSCLHGRRGAGPGALAAVKGNS